MSTPETSPQPGDAANAPLKRVGRSLTDPESPDPKTRMEGENGTPPITLNGNHAGRKREAPGVPQPIQEVSYLSQGRTRERMAIGVIPLTRNGPSHLIYRVPAKTAPRLRSRSQKLWKIAGEALGMKPEPTDIRGKMTRPRQVQEVMTGREDHWRSQRKLEQVREPKALGPVWSH